jgi:transposase
LGEDLRRELICALAQGARTHGWKTDLWTCPRIAELIERRFGVRYHVDHIGRLMRSLGWSHKKPTRRAKQRDEQAIARWVKSDWPRIKKTPAAKGRTSSSSTRAASR